MTTPMPTSLFKASNPVMPAGFYSGDKPNPLLREFVAKHQREHPWTPASDTYAVAAFNHAIETTKNTAIYGLHAYHLGKKPHDAIETYIEHYTSPGDVVLDPFCGSGSTAVAALIKGRKAIGIDRSPAATFVSRFYVADALPERLEKAFADLSRRVEPDMQMLYGTRCHRCRGDATIHYIIYSNEYECPRCLSKVTLFEASFHDPAVCPHCLERGVSEPIVTRLGTKGIRPVAVNFSCGGRCSPKRMTRSIVGDDADIKAFAEIDLPAIAAIESKPIPYPIPVHRMMNVDDDTAPWGDEWRPSRNFRRVTDLFTHRNLWAIAACMSAAGDDQDLRAVITSGMMAVSRKAQHLDGGGGYIPGNWALPPMSKQRNVLDSLSKVFAKTKDAKEALHRLFKSHDVILSTQSATNLNAIASDSIDYVFTDPPYGGAVQYAELNFIWEAWLGLDTHWHDQEIIVNATRGKSESDWASMMKLALAECFRVLKPGRWISLCYHDTAEGTWSLLQDLMAEVGFVVGESDRALFIDTGGNTYNQRVGDKVTKRDLVINFRKPRLGEAGGSRLVIPEEADARTFGDLARQIIRDFLQANPASTKDRVFDELVSRMVRAGQMQAHNFEELLREVADETKDAGGASRWYLKESEEGRIDAAETAKEDAASGIIEKFIAKSLEKGYAEGVHYSDLFEHYLYAVKDKPRRSLADWLPDYFYKTEAGTWRPPVDEDERELKTETRATGENRRIKRYAAMLLAGVAMPKETAPSAATLSEWMRHAKRSGLYEAGKLLYERGGLDSSKLTEEQQVEVEEDYQVCVRALQRAAGGEATTAPRKRGRKKKTETGE